MSLNRTAYLVISPCRSLSYLSKWLPSCGISMLQQTTNKQTLRIQHTCITKRNVHASETLHRQQNGPSQKSSPCEVNDHQSNELRASHKLRLWSFNVNSFGKILIKKTPFDAMVTPVSPLEYPAADKAFVTLKIKSDTELDGELFETIVNSLQANAEYKDDKLLLSGDFSNLQMTEVETSLQNQGVSVLWHAEVPISFDADIKTSSHGTVVLERLENQNCVVLSEHGNCHVNKVKSSDIRISSSTGDIISKNLLQGNATITTQGSGSITTGRLQGQTFNLSTEAGAISCKDIYAVEAALKTTSGNIELDNIHAECEITTTEGSVNVGSLDGSVKATTDTGNITAYLVRHKEADLSTQTGDISLQVPSDVKTKFQLEASSITVTPELHTETVDSPSPGPCVLSGEWNSGEDNQLKASTKQGSITVAVQSWFESLKLNK